MQYSYVNSVKACKGLKKAYYTYINAAYCKRKGLICYLLHT